MSLIEKLIDPISTILDKVVPDADTKAKLAHEIATLADTQSHEEIMAGIDQAKAVIVAEANSDSWIAKNWRPLTMLVFTFIVANNYILYPYLSLFWADAPELELPVYLWDLLKIGLGGYVVGRSAEKVATNWKANG